MSYHNPSFPGDRLISDLYRKTIVVSIGGVECDIEQPCLREVEEFVVQILGQSRHVSPSLASLTGMEKGKLKEDVSHGDNESQEDYIEAFGRLDVSESSNNSDRSYSPSIEVKYPPVACVKPKEKSSQKKGKSKIIEDVEEESGDSASFGEHLKKGKMSEKENFTPKCKIKNPEAYLDNPMNLHHETSVKNRPYKLLVHAQLVKDYDLKFEENIKYNDRFGKLDAKTATWGDGRVVIKKWIRICERNKLKKEDGIFCEFFRKNDVIYAVKIPSSVQKISKRKGFLLDLILFRLFYYLISFVLL